MEILLMESILILMVNVHQAKTNQFCFGYFWIFGTTALTLIQRNPYIYVFRALFCFCNI